MLKTINFFRYVNESVYPGTVYPHFASGPVYLASTETIAAILRHSGEINKNLCLEDVLFTGVLAEKANVIRVDQRQHFLDVNFKIINLVVRI